MKFISKPKCKRDIKSWRGYRRYNVVTHNIWTITKYIFNPFGALREIYNRKVKLNEKT